MSSAILSFRSTTKIYRHGLVEVPAVRGVDLDLAPGTITAVMGPSGSGKSTLLHLAAGMVIASSGQVLVDGDDVGRRSPADLAHLRRTDVGVVFQQYNLLPTLTALENVTLPLELDGMGLRQARAIAEAALERVGIEPPLDRYPDDLSGGQQQRVAIARAVAVPRKLVLADEPTGALDTQTGDRVMDLFTTLAEGGAAVLVVTHEPRVAGFADRVVTLRDGQVVSDTATRSPRPPSDQARRPDRDPWAPQHDGPTDGTGAGGLAGRPGTDQAEPERPDGTHPTGGHDTDDHGQTGGPHHADDGDRFGDPDHTDTSTVAS
ncbi:MAG TPA: ABC transporter ATP-binding protein [Acidimicrobiales bacterium]|nr:ABC transporter ATP-binding protein [Acidimicrobiales bacterium]HRA35384.1 ABC transporter ATP-binding protein [Acidimicrobiales bacterium]